MPPVTTALIVANVAIFLLQSLLPGLAVPFALWPLGASQIDPRVGFAPWQLVTYAFLHGGLMHLAFNMFALYMFGGAIERVFGGRRYLDLLRRVRRGGGGHAACRGGARGRAFIRPSARPVACSACCSRTRSTSRTTASC